MLDPVWNKPVKEFDRALDPLGMNRVTDRLLGDLLLGITSLTPRARYYAFYVWAVDQIRRKKLAKTFPQFRSVFYDLERLFMMSCVAHYELEPLKNHGDINGTAKGSRVWYESSSTVPLNFTYFGHKLGGYGQYYEGSINNLGLIEQFDEDEYERPTELGEKIAKSFDRVAQKSKILSYLGKSKISKNLIQNSGKEICLCKLREQENNEKELLQDLFFGFSGLKDRYSINRRDSLGLILYLIDTAHSLNVQLDSQTFLNACYFGQFEKDGKSYDTKIPKELENISDKWKFVGIHDNLALCGESILQCFLQFLDQNPRRGGALSTFLEKMKKKSVMDKFAKMAKLKITGKPLAEMPLTSIINEIAKNNKIDDFFNDTKKGSKKFDSISKILSPVSEFYAINLIDENIYEKKIDFDIIFSSWLLTILCTYMRTIGRDDFNDRTWKWFSSHSQNDLSMATLKPDIDAKLHDNFTLAQFIDIFLEKYVIDQAELIYHEKIRSGNPKRWFYKESLNYFKERDYQAKHRNIRFSSVISLLEDLDLISTTETESKLTNKGKQILSRIIKPKNE